MIEVLFAIPQLDHAGPDRVLFELLVGLDRARFSPALMVGAGEGYYLQRLPGDVPVHVLGAGRYPVLRALRRVRQAPPDVVLSTLRMNLTLGIAALGFPRRTKLVLRPANDLSADFGARVASSPLKQRVAHRVVLESMRRADAIVCQSAAMRRDLATLLGGNTPLLHVISNPVDVARVTTAATATTAVLAGRPALVSAGRLAPQKGFDLLLAALPAVRAQHPELHLTILGNGPDRAALERQARSLGLTAHVTFAGFCDEPLPLFRAADLFVLASRYEGFPNAALEALACGTPIVLTDCPGASAEMVVPGANGRLATAPDSAAIAAAVLVALAERARYDRAQIIADCEQRYGAAKIVHTYERVLAQVAAA